jgi:4-amino-4-deoxy-L-arabinose transferase-like glycosyltransferase
MAVNPSRSVSRASSRRCGRHGLVSLRDGTCVLCRTEAGVPRKATWSLWGLATTVLVGGAVAWGILSRSPQPAPVVSQEQQEQAQLEHGEIVSVSRSFGRPRNNPGARTNSAEPPSVNQPTDARGAPARRTSPLLVSGEVLQPVSAEDRYLDQDMPTKGNGLTQPDNEMAQVPLPRTNLAQPPLAPEPPRASLDTP